jgi:hypothetical protein
VADNSTIIPNCFLPPAANAEDTMHQNAVGSPNLFDIELASSWGSQHHCRVHGIAVTEMPVLYYRNLTAITKSVQTKRQLATVSPSF